jgi:hypothetical protein
MVEGLASVLKQELVPYKLGQKLIAQSYDGTAVFSGEKMGLSQDERYLSSCTFHSVMLIN